jgi:hypothetical protein
MLLQHPDDLLGSESPFLHLWILLRRRFHHGDTEDPQASLSWAPNPSRKPPCIKTCRSPSTLPVRCVAGHHRVINSATNVLRGLKGSPIFTGDLPTDRGRAAPRTEYARPTSLQARFRLGECASYGGLDGETLPSPARLTINNRPAFTVRFLLFFYNLCSGD